MSIQPRAVVGSVARRYSSAGSAQRLALLVVLSTAGSALFCYALYALVGLSVSWSDMGGKIALLAPVLTPACISPLVYVPLERSHRRSRRLLQEVEDTRALLLAEIAERKEAQSRLEHQVRHDPLTGVLNRRGFFEACTRRGNSNMTVYAVDVDRFKQVNDRWGHQVGDAVLCEVAKALRETVADSGWVARTGGDEFVVLQRRPTPDQAIPRCLTSLAVQVPDGTWLDVNASVGHAPLHPGELIDTALSVADREMFSTKAGTTPIRDAAV